jgi:ATP-dependent RNA helicase DDX5/DBP2
LIKILSRIVDGSKILVFSDTKKNTDMLCRRLRENGYPALSIHGDKSQAERDWVLADFRSGKAPILIATDVVGRGLGMSNKVSRRATHTHTHREFTF